MFENYDLKEPVLRALQAKGLSTPTPIQAATLPDALEGRDILGQARTGTGKTLAYALPIAEQLEADSGKGRAPRALVVAPTRELALQVAGEFAWAAPHLRVVTIYGGTGYAQQARALRRGVDVVIATPGRALDFLQQGVLDLGAVQIAVLDEADEMLRAGFEEDVETLLAATPEERQTMLFSATLPAWAKRLSERYLRDPLRVNIVSKESVTYREIGVETPPAARLAVLSDVLHVHGGMGTIVFTHTKAEVDKLAQILSARGHSVEAIHGDLSQVQRERVVERFRSHQVNVLVGTNVAARGLDIPEVDLVVHYRIPSDPDAYQHRSGRTGRAGREGTVILIYGPRERKQLSQLERAVGRRFERAAPPRPEEIEDAKLQGLLESIESQPAADKQVWQGVAELWLEERNKDAIAGLLAMILGGAPAPLSLLTGEEGWTTLKLSGGSVSVPQVVRLLKEAGAGEVGRIERVRNGALADVRPESVPGLEQADLDGLRVSRANKAPAERRPKGGAGAKRKGRAAESRR
ncbi:MAG TPA: DEAD/DEAH box helicase [Trueperaceae bacterium]